MAETPARAAVCWLGGGDIPLGPPYRVLPCPDPRALRLLARSNDLDLIVADLDFLRVDPYRLVQGIRRDPRTQALPILFLSSPGGGTEAAAALRAGADDHLFKPVEPSLLAARLDAALGSARQFARPEPWAPHVLRSRDGRLVLNAKDFRCQVQTGLEYEDRKLTKRQFEVLLLLLRRANRVVSWKDFYAKGWKPRRLQGRSRTLVQHVMRVRQALGPLGARLETVAGIGYRWND